MSNFNKQVGKIIDKTKAKKLKANWKKTNIATESSFVGADILHRLLNVPGAVGLRVSYGLDDAGVMQPIFYACGSDGKVIPVSSDDATALSADDESDGADASVPCPPYC